MSFIANYYKILINSIFTQKRKVVLIFIENMLYDSTEEIYCSTALQNLPVTVIKIYQNITPPILIRKLLSSSSITVVSRHLNKTYQNKFKQKAINFYYIIDDDIINGRRDKSLSFRYRRKLAAIKKDTFPLVQTNSLGIMVSSEYLAKLYASHFNCCKIISTRPTYVAPSAHKDRDNDYINIIYASSSIHNHDLLFIEPIFENLIKKYSNIKIHIINGRSLANKLGKYPCIRLYKSINWEAYKKFAQELSMDIALCPVLDTPFNKGKSYIKFFDFARFGAVGIYSNTEFYQEIINHGENGFLVENRHEDWLTTIEDLIQNRNKLKSCIQMATKNALELSKNNQQKQRKIWIEVIKSSYVTILKP